MIEKDVYTCRQTPFVALNITLTDSFGDGWNQNVLELRQNSVPVAYLGIGFTRGTTSGPFLIYIEGNLRTEIYAYIIGTKAYKIEFLMDFSGRTMYQFRNLYNVFSNSLLDTFQQTISMNETADIKRDDSYKNATWTLTSILCILVLLICFLAFKLIKIKSQLNQTMKINPTADITSIPQQKNSSQIMSYPEGDHSRSPEKQHIEIVEPN